MQSCHVALFPWLHLTSHFIDNSRLIITTGLANPHGQDILIVVETVCTEMIGRKSAPFPHESLLMGLLELQTSTAALAEPRRARRLCRL